MQIGYDKNNNKVSETWHLSSTVLQNWVNPKINAPEVSKGPTKLGRNFQHKYEISEKTNDIRLGN